VDQPLAPGARIGIFGGGQLGRMLSVAAAQLGFRTRIYSDTTGPAFDVSEDGTVGAYEDVDAVRKFADGVDVVTYEFENVPHITAEAASAVTPLRPGARALEVAQDRLTEKSFIADLGISVAPFAAITTEADIETAIKTTATPAILKTRRLGYDGKGQASISGAGDVAAALKLFADQPAILEARIDFAFEISMIAVRADDGTMVFYDAPRNTHKNGILDTSEVPCGASPEIEEDARDIARTIADALDYVGVLAVEFFVLPEAAKGQRLMVNEIAPRVHNSGHWTLDACLVSQFENHIRAIAGWPLGPGHRHSNARMTNLIGPEAQQWQALAGQDQALHLYGKGQAREGRKMGHRTQLGPKTGDVA
jgi:5-(carboxyamino)imidazole ribonucleotide synthase